MLHLAEDVPAQVVMEQVARHLGALGHPVEPDAGDLSAAVDVITLNGDIDRAVELDACHFRAAKKLMHVDIVNRVATDGAERAPQAADDPGLLTMRDVVVADDMAADAGLVPAVLQGAADAVGVWIGGPGDIRVVELVAILSSATPQHLE